MRLSLVLGASALALAGCVVDYGGTSYVIFGPYALPKNTPQPAAGAPATTPAAAGTTAPAAAAPPAQVGATPPPAMAQTFDGGAFTLAYDATRFRFIEATAADALNGEIGALAPRTESLAEARIAFLRDPADIEYADLANEKETGLTRVRYSRELTLGGERAREVFGLSSDNEATYYLLSNKDGITQGVRLTTPEKTPSTATDALVEDVRAMAGKWVWK